MKIDRRTVTQRIECERRSGMPICAAVSGRNLGYFLAANADELTAYLASFDRRIKQVTLTRDACRRTLEKMNEVNSV